MILGERVTGNNAYIESFNGKYRDELFDREIFTALTEASILTKQWRKEYNQIGSLSPLDCRPPLAEATISLTPT